MTIPDDLPFHLPEFVRVTLYTDSYVTLCRLTQSRKFRGIPESLQSRCLAIRHLADRVVLLGGHPNKYELAAGKRSDGLPCSHFNVRCDALCGERVREFLANQRTTNAP